MYTSIYEDEYKLSDYNVNIFIGMRGMGKTFSALSPLYENSPKSDNKILFCRLTKDEVSLLTSDLGSVFKDINAVKVDKEPLHAFAEKGGMFNIYKYHLDSDGNKVPQGSNLGYVCSMPVLRKSNGAGFSDISQYIVDEFIPSSQPYRGDKFRDIMYCWETINRNREDKGRRACKLILLSNSNDIYDSVLVGFNLVQISEHMCANGEQNYFDDARSIALHIMKPHESFREFKQQSAVARALKGTPLYEASYENKFAMNDFSGVIERDVRGWAPMFSLNGKAYCYTKMGKYHLTYRRAEVPDYNIKAPFIKRAFMCDFNWMELDVANNKVTYQSYELKRIFLEALK